MDYKEIEKIFYKDGYRLAHQHLEQDVSSKSLTTAIENLYESVDGLMEAFIKRSATEGRAVACKKGCSWCCHQKVYAVTHEFMYLSDHVLQHMDKTTVRNMELRAQKQTPCLFLESGTCSIYKYRPMACRIYVSSSAIACEKALEESHSGDTFPDLFEFPLRAGHMMNQGFVAYLKQTRFVVTEVPLNEGYLSMKTMGQTMDGWINGTIASK